MGASRDLTRRISWKKQQPHTQATRAASALRPPSPHAWTSTNHASVSTSSHHPSGGARQPALQPSCTPTASPMLSDTRPALPLAWGRASLDSFTCKSLIPRRIHGRQHKGFRKLFLLWGNNPRRKLRSMERCYRRWVLSWKSCSRIRGNSRNLWSF